jgi:hypothetical protein
MIISLEKVFFNNTTNRSKILIYIVELLFKFKKKILRTKIQIAAKMMLLFSALHSVTQDYKVECGVTAK